MKNAFLLCVLSLFILLSSCKKDDDENLTPPQQHQYSSVVYYSSSLPMMGGTINQAGNLITFTMPFLPNSSPSIPLTSAKVMEITSANVANIFHDFGNANFANIGFGGYTIDNQFGYIPSNCNVNLAAATNSDVFVCWNWDQFIYKISNGQISNYQILGGCIAMTCFKNSLYVMTSPVWNQNTGQYSSSAKIYRIDPYGNMNLYYDFTTAVTFNFGGGMTGSSNAMYPLDMLVDIKMSNDSNLYVASGYDHKIYKIDKNQNMSVFANDIFCPVSIDINDQNQMFVISAPRYMTDSLFNIVQIKPMQLYSINGNEKNIIYQYASTNKFTDGYTSTPSDSMISVGGRFNLTIRPDNNFLVEIYSEGKILLVE